MTNSRLRQICVENNWFTNGDNDQYKRMLDLNAGGLIPLNECDYLTNAIARTIWICSDNVNYDDIVTTLLENEVMLKGDRNPLMVADVVKEMRDQIEKLKTNMTENWHISDVECAHLSSIVGILEYYADKLDQIC